MSNLITRLPRGFSSVELESAHDNMIGDVIILTTIGGTRIRICAESLGDHELDIEVANETGVVNVHADPEAGICVD